MGGIAGSQSRDISPHVTSVFFWCVWHISGEISSQWGYRKINGRQRPPEKWNSEIDSALIELPFWPRIVVPTITPCEIWCHLQFAAHCSSLNWRLYEKLEVPAGISQAIPCFPSIYHAFTVFSMLSWYFWDFWRNKPTIGLIGPEKF